MSADTPEQAPTPPTTAPEETQPSPNTAALEELWRLADQLSAAIRAHLDPREESDRQEPTPHPHPPKSRP
ncbi:hypothetical protein [Streptomyces sp. ME19-01-6]|uniref:hypothetical protein n=1 Tax=Streptomyces sp. ME19-01-6 TaxID=3028686 RepID=UPI0029A370EE|nr:hypothetical protein [Streptomyces sp. ME19-01-6]MDX3231071.1 hypothetical protein [Streptomyces sp. ME19-01-6]